MRISACLPALLLSALALFQPSAHAQGIPRPTQQDRVATHPDLAARSTLKGTLPAWVSAARAASQDLPPGTRLGVTLVMRRSPELEAAFSQLLLDQQNPNSSRYHQWLSPEQIGDQYGPTQHDLDAVTAWLEEKGLSVSAITPSRVFVEASGPAAAVAAAFNTRIGMFLFNNKPHFSAVSDPSVPSAFAPVIASISGLTEVELKPMSHVEALPARVGASQPGDEARPRYTTQSGAHYLYPADFATIFNINPLYTANIKGNGQKVAVIGQSNINLTDITDFEKATGLPTNPPNLVLAGTDPGAASGTSGDEGESDLDLQRLIGVAPGVTADLVYSARNPTTGQSGIYTAAQYEVNTLKDPVMTISYGACEAQAGPSGVQLWSTLFQQASAQGITVFVSSGDSGAATCDQSFTTAPTAQKLSINYICANPYSTCVGGTEFVDTANPATFWSSASDPVTGGSALGYIPEGAWNDPVLASGSGGTTYQVAGSGGGLSTSVTKPSFQAGPGVPADGKRDVPDVSFPASGHDGYFGCQADLTFAGGGTGDCANLGGVIFSGTSAAAPGWAGVTALLNQKLGGTGQGNLNPLIYRLGALTTANPFHDVNPSTVGVACDLTVPSLCNNSTPGPTTLTGGLAGYAVTPGYDLVTGWGSPDVNAFIAGAAGQVTLVPTTTTLSASSTTTTTAKTVVFTATVTAASGCTPTGTVQFSSNGTSLGAPVPLVNGKAVSPAESFSTIGTYIISAAYSGSSVCASSAAPTVTLNVTASGTAPATAILTATAPSGTTQSMIGFTVMLAATEGASGATPTGTIQFELNGVNYGNPLTLAAGSATFPAALLPAGTNTITAVYSGDNTFAGTTSNAVSVVITALPSVTTISPLTETTSTTGFFVISAKVTPASGSGPIPAGVVTLFQTGTNPGEVGSVTLDETGSTTVTLDATFLTPGEYQFFWVYSGDGNYATSQSATGTYTVQAGFVPTVGLTPAAPSVTVAAGTPITNTVTVATGNGFSGTVNLTCAAVFNGTTTITTPLVPACSVAPASITLSDTSISGQAQVTLTTTAEHTALKPGGVASSSLPHPLALRSVAGTAFAGFVLFSLPLVRRRRGFSALASLLMLAFVAGLAGCGGGSSTPAPPTSTGTPSGAYTVTVSGGGASTAFTLNVQ